jgi:predicted phage terminase large subunit-like protein
MTRLPAGKWGDSLMLSWDTALSPGELSDYSVCVVLQVRGEAAWVLDVVRGRFDYPTLKRKALELYRHWSRIGKCRLVIEERGSGMSLIQDLRDQYIFPIAVRPSGDKVMRMHAQTARIESGAVFLPKRAAWLEEFRREIMAFPHARHDDQVDAFSQALDRAFNHRPPRAVISTFQNHG